VVSEGHPVSPSLGIASSGSDIVVCMPVAERKPLPSDEGMTPRVLIIGIPATTQKKQDGNSKPKTN
jgi:hypothetical protein